MSCSALSWLQVGAEEIPHRAQGRVLRTQNMNTCSRGLLVVLTVTTQTLQHHSPMKTSSSWHKPLIDSFSPLPALAATNQSCNQTALIPIPESKTKQMLLKHPAAVTGNQIHPVLGLGHQLCHPSSPLGTSCFSEAHTWERSNDTPPLSSCTEAACQVRSEP